MNLALVVLGCAAALHPRLYWFAPVAIVGLYRAGISPAEAFDRLAAAMRWCGLACRALWEMAIAVVAWAPGEFRRLMGRHMEAR